MPHIDTLATARRLELAGLPTEQARAVSEAISDAIRDAQPDLSNLATKSDLANLASVTKSDLANLASVTKSDLANLASVTKSDLANHASAIKADIAQVINRLDQLSARMDQMATKVELKELEVRIMDKLRSQMIWFYSVQAAFLGIGVTLFKLLSK